MPKPGIKIISEGLGTGPELKKGNVICVKYDIQLNHGDYLVQNQEQEFVFGSREMIAGFNYGLEGMKSGGARKFKASPHLCHRDNESGTIPKNAAMIFNIKQVMIRS